MLELFLNGGIDSFSNYLFGKRDRGLLPRNSNSLLEFFHGNAKGNNILFIYGTKYQAHYIMNDNRLQLSRNSNQFC